jgi:hypothetical protein
MDLLSLRNISITLYNEILTSRFMDPFLHLLNDITSNRSNTKSKHNVHATHGGNYKPT